AGGGHAAGPGRGGRVVGKPLRQRQNEIDEPGGRFRREIRDAALELLEPLEDIVERVETAEEPTKSKLDVLADQACRHEGDKQRYVRRHPVASSGRMLSVEGTGEWLCLRRQ